MRSRLVQCLLCALLSVVATVARAEEPIPGPNVNMVSGTGWPGGDPFLQRQNEPSIAVSTRNPLHLLAGANDYRTVDLPGLPDGRVIGDAWLGVFKSFDGGRRWQSTLLPGYPQEQGVSSPIKGYEAGADPTVRAGANGLFYYSGIAFNRGEKGLGALFVARFIDLNNIEGANFDVVANKDPMKYIDMEIVDSGTAGQFVDKPWLAVDIPRDGAELSNIQVTSSPTVHQVFPCGNVYLAYSVFPGFPTNQDKNVRSQIRFARSTDCGATWSHPLKISETHRINQGAGIAVDPATGAVYVAWREFASKGPDAILIARSMDGGKKFSKAVEVAGFPPFQQGTTSISFRTNAFPSMAVDRTGRVYVVWSQRGLGPGGSGLPDTRTTGDARVVLKTSPDGVDWSAPAIAIDNPPDQDGHQLMPSITLAGGKLVVLFYDLRFDHTTQVFTHDVTTNTLLESREPGGDLAAPAAPEKVWTEFVADAAPAGLSALKRRHTLDVRIAQADPGPAPVFTSVPLSKYIFGSRPESLKIEQLQFNPPNLPLFAGGTVPFIGDYIDIAGLSFLPDPNDPAGWVYNTGLTGPTVLSGTPNLPVAPVFHAAWTDNRDVRPPNATKPDGSLDWTKYVPPNQPGQKSLFDPTQSTTPCTPAVASFTGSRNQNIYTSRITQGLSAGSLQNSKQQGTVTFNGSELLIQRAYTLFVQNATQLQKSFRLTIPPRRTQSSSSPIAPYPRKSNSS